MAGDRTSDTGAPHGNLPRRWLNSRQAADYAGYRCLKTFKGLPIPCRTKNKRGDRLYEVSDIDAYLESLPKAGAA